VVIARRAAALLIAASALAPQRAHAQNGASPVDLVAALPPEPGSGAGAAILVGRSGELYHAVAPGRWQRRGGGGVAVELRGAVRAGPRSDEVLAVADQTPPFRFQAGAWRAEPLTNRGAAALSGTGPLALLVVGRHVYSLHAGAWQRRVSAARRVTAAWAAGPTALVVATSDGALARHNGRRSTPVRTPLPAGQPIVALIGASPAALYGRGESGTWIRIDRGGAPALVPARELAGFEEHAWGLGPDGRLWLAGTLTGGNARRPILVRADRNRLVPAGDLPALAPGDRVAVLLGHAPTGEVLIATRAGAVSVRDKKGTWTEGSASGALPQRVPRAGAPSGAPARTR
jgi:hypothetical protein